MQVESELLKGLTRSECDRLALLLAKLARSLDSPD
jgi:hypothetical protein